MAFHRRCDNNSPDCLGVSLLPHYKSYSLLTRPVASSSFPMSPLAKSLASSQKTSRPWLVNASKASQRHHKRNSAAAFSSESSQDGIGISLCYSGHSWIRTLRLTQHRSRCTSRRTATSTLLSGSILSLRWLQQLVLHPPCCQVCLRTRRADSGSLLLLSLCRCWWGFRCL
jgi:hypothetical protein